jgi:hypothetical protein
VRPWWVKKESKGRARGQLCRAYVRQIVDSPYEVSLKNGEINEHVSENIIIGHFRADTRYPIDPIPISNLPVSKDVRLTLNYGKMRPALILSLPGTTIDEKFRKPLPKWYFMTTYLVAPFFSGIETEFIRKIKLCEYTQFFGIDYRWTMNTQIPSCDLIRCNLSSQV